LKALSRARRRRNGGVEPASWAAGLQPLVDPFGETDAGQGDPAASPVAFGTPKVPVHHGARVLPDLPVFKRLGDSPDAKINVS